MIGCKKFRIFLFENQLETTWRWKKIYQGMKNKNLRINRWVIHPYANYNCPFLKIGLCDLLPVLLVECITYKNIKCVMRSSKVSLKSTKFNFHSCDWLHVSSILQSCFLEQKQTPLKWVYWLQRYKQLKALNNKMKQKLSALFGYILESVFVSSCSFASSIHNWWL